MTVFGIVHLSTLGHHCSLRKIDVKHRKFDAEESSRPISSSLMQITAQGIPVPLAESLIPA